MTVDSQHVASAADDLERAEYAIALTGAGMSVESGIPSYRGDDGLWNDHDESALHIRRFRADPEAFWEDWLHFHDDAALEDVEPHEGHEALSELEAAGVLDAIVTQNVDGLHQAAGSETVVELHGTHDEIVCPACGVRENAAPALQQVREGEGPPTCDRCEEIYKPGSVLFGQQLPVDALSRARDHVQESDCVLVVGSSLVVEPAGSMPERAARTGASLIEVNPEETRISDRADHVFRAPAGEALPAIRDVVRD